MKVLALYMKLIYKLGFFISILITVAAIVATIVFGLKFGADFRGGSVIELVFVNNRPTIAEMNQTVSTLPSIKNVSISPVADKGAIIRLDAISEADHQAMLTILSSKFGAINELSFNSIGPTIGNELKQKSISAMIVLLIAIVVYIAYVFRKLAIVVSPWAMGAATIVALIHDIAIPIGVFAILGHYRGIEISAVFVAAALTILGYSVSDTVVVLDRMRENVLRYGRKEGFAVLVHKSIMQTLARSLNTTFNTLLSLFAVYFFGGESIRYFALALIIGIALGAYSSIFVASPVLIWWYGRNK